MSYNSEQVYVISVNNVETLIEMKIRLAFKSDPNFPSLFDLTETTVQIFLVWGNL